MKWKYVYFYDTGYLVNDRDLEIKILWNIQYGIVAYFVTLFFQSPWRLIFEWIRVKMHMI